MMKNGFSPLGSFIPASVRSVRTPAPRGVTDFLTQHDRLSVLMPAAARMAALQKECTEQFPLLFERCQVLHLQDGTLVISAPNAAMSTKMKQQVPKIKEFLLHRGWAVETIKMKVQLPKAALPPKPPKDLTLPQTAIHSLIDLETALPETEQNEPLKNALMRLVKRHIPQN